MKKSLLRLYLAAALLPAALGAFPARASHIPGGHITYTQLSATSYQVTLELYRNCEGIALPQTQNVSVRGVGCSYQAQQNMLQLVPAQSDIEVSDVNPSQTTACSTPPNLSVLGIKKYTYSGTISVQGMNCTGYIFSYTECCRNATNNNLVDPNNANLYFETYASTAVSGLVNTSPVMSGVPCPYVCVNDTVTYLPQITDPDGDSLAFSLVSAQSGNGAFILYPVGFSAMQPFGTSNFHTYDSSTGLMAFKPTVTGLFTVVQQVEEFRKINGAVVKVGSMMHDAQFYVMNCTSPAPRLSATVSLNQNSGVTTWAAGAVVPVEAGHPLQVAFNATTSAPLLTLQLTSNQQLEIPGSSFTATSAGNLASGILIWTPTVQQVRNEPYYFSFRFRDSASPVPNDLYGVIKLRVQATAGTPETAAARAAIPNVLSQQAPFSPVFTVPGAAAGTYSLTIYDRLGRQVYQSSRYNNNWSGAGAAEGMYLYRLQHLQTGELQNGKLTVLK